MTGPTALGVAPTLASTAPEPAAAVSPVVDVDPRLLPRPTVTVASPQPAPAAPPAGPRVFETLSDGTPSETPVYLIAGAETGPTVFVIAGIHGDEPAPPLAADALLRWEIGRGLMYVVPRANPTALAAGKRRTPGSRFKDLNRNFPQQGDTAPRGLMAREIWDVVARVKPAWLLDLHEGIDFNRNNPKSVGSSVLFNRSVHDLEQPAQRLIDAVNETVDTPWRKFTLLTRTAPGSLVRAAAERLDTRALILETTSHSEPIDVRVAQHLVMVETLLSELGMAPNKP